MALKMAGFTESASYAAIERGAGAYDAVVWRCDDPGGLGPVHLSRLSLCAGRAAIQAPRAVVVITLAPLTGPQQVRLELRSRPGRYLTMATLRELTGLTTTGVNSAIQTLSKQGQIRRLMPARMARQNTQAYAWKL